MHVRNSARLTADARARWIAALPETSAAGAGIDLCEALQDSSRAVSVRYLEAVSDDGHPLALGLVHTIHGLDLASYVGGVAHRICAAIGRTGWRPLRVDVTFFEIPFCNLPGLLLTREGERREAEVAREMIRVARAELPCDILCVKTYDGKPSGDALAALGMLHASFLANTSLPLPFTTFDEYARSLPAQWRADMRRNQRTFAAANGSVRCVTDLDAAARTTAELFHATTAFHAAKGDLGRPLDIDETFLTCLGRNARPDDRFLVTCEVDGRPVVTALVLRSGGHLVAVKAGVHYAIARPARAYFNFYYAMIEWAIAHRVASIQLCAEAYDVKRRLGGTTAPVSYYVDLRSRWIGPPVRLVMQHFAAQRGAAASDGSA